MEYGRNNQEEQNETEGWSQEEPQQQPQNQQQPQQQQQPQEGQQQSNRQQQQKPQYYHPGRPQSPIFGKKAIMTLLVISMLLVAIGSVWLSIYTVPDYKKYSESKPGYRKGFRDWAYFSQTIAGILATIGAVLGSILSIYSGLISDTFEEEQKKGMLILAGFFFLGLVLVFNHFSVFVGIV